MIFLFVDPVTLTGEGDYNLNSIKEEEVTESFLGFGQTVRGCQNEEHYDECTTRHYIKHMREKCGCLPLSSALSEKVIFIINEIITIIFDFNLGSCLQNNKGT